MLQGRARNYCVGVYRLGVNQLCFRFRESVHAEQRVERHAPGSCMLGLTLVVGARVVMCSC
jgi:hypothetical protein